MMSIKKIGALALVVMVAAGFLNLDAGKRGRQVYRATDVRAGTAAGRTQIRQEAGRVMGSVSEWVESIKKVLYSDMEDAAIIDTIKVMLPWFGKSQAEIRQLMADLDVDGAQKVQDSNEAKDKLDREKAALAEDPNNPAKKAAVAQAEAQWSRKKKAAAAAIGAVTLTAVAYGISKLVGPVEPGKEAESYRVTRWIGEFAPYLEKIAKATPGAIKRGVGLGEADEPSLLGQSWDATKRAARWARSWFPGGGAADPDAPAGGPNLAGGGNPAGEPDPDVAKQAGVGNQPAGGN